MAQTLTAPTKLQQPLPPQLLLLQGIFCTALIALHFNCSASTSTSLTSLGASEMKGQTLSISNIQCFSHRLTQREEKVRFLNKFTPRQQLDFQCSVHLDMHLINYKMETLTPQRGVC